MADSNAIDINFDAQGIEEAAQLLRNIGKGAPEAAARALNRTANSIKDDASKVASRAFAVSKEDAKERMRVSKASTANTVAVVKRKGSRLSAKRFPHDPNTNPGVKGGRAAILHVRRAGSGMVLNEEGKLSKAFVIRGRGAEAMQRYSVHGHKIYRRVGRNRTHLVIARGLSVPDMLAAPDVRTEIEANATKKLNIELHKEINKLLESGG